MEKQLYEKNTKMYWEPHLMQLRPLILRRFFKTLVMHYSIVFVSTFVIAVILGGPVPGIGSLSLKESLLIWLITMGVFTIYILILYRGISQIKAFYGDDPEIMEETSFHDITSILHPDYNFHLPYFFFDREIGEFFPRELDVIGYSLRSMGRSRFKLLSYLLLNTNIFYGFGSRAKYKSIEKLIHMKEGVALRHESRRFKVTYKKYSKELVRIDLCEDEEYPAHCHYEELVERINVMF